MDIRLIATDMDNTLLRSDKHISAETISVLRRCRERGIRLAFASARSVQSQQRFVEAIAPDAILANGGALVIDREAPANAQTVYRRAMDVPLASALLARCMAARSVHYCTLETEGGYFINYPQENTQIDYHHGIYTDFSKGYPTTREAYKLVVELSDKREALRIAQEFPAVKHVHYSDEDWVCFTHREATKWLALQALAAHYGIPIENVAAFGDDWNDYDMLRGSGVGVAMRNSIPEVLAVADAVCGSHDEDGVARWLEENVLL